MKGYIYITSTGTDPFAGSHLNDPVFSRPPSLGACMPNIRQQVERGDWIFCVSGKTKNVAQYVIGGFVVDEKISALRAYKDFPDYRLHRDQSGNIQGNIIVDSRGNQHPLDHHKTFKNRLQNYIVGRDPIAFRSEAAANSSRRDTLNQLSNIFGKPSNSVIGVLGRWRKMDQGQIEALVDWMKRTGAT